MKTIPHPRNSDGTLVKAAGLVKLRARDTGKQAASAGSERTETRLFVKVLITTSVPTMLSGIRYVLANDWADQKQGMVRVYWPPDVPYSDYGKQPEPGYDVEMRTGTLTSRDHLLPMPPGTEFNDIYGVYNYVCNSDRKMRQYAAEIREHAERMRRESTRQQAVLDAQRMHLVKRVASVIIDPNWRQKAIRTVPSPKKL